MRAWFWGAGLLATLAGGCAGRWALSESFQKQKTAMTPAQAEAVLARTIQIGRNSGGLCVGGMFESLPGSAILKDGKLTLAANALVATGSHVVSSGSIAAGNLREGIATDYKRVPGKYIVDLAQVKEIQVYQQKQFLADAGCGGVPLPLTDYRLIFRVANLPGGAIHLYVHAEDLDTVLAALAVLFPRMEFIKPAF